MSTMMYHPWRDLRDRKHVELMWKELPPGLRAVTDGTSAIIMEPRLLQVERRCSLAHELAHIDLGHTPPVSTRDEEAARTLAAERLIAWPALIDAARWAHDAHEAAEELWVTPEVLEHRLQGLSALERERLSAAGRHRGV